MKVESTYYQLIPENVYQILGDIEAILKSEISGFCPDNLKQVISIICYHVRKDNEAVPLKMAYIKQAVPQGDKYLSGLMDLGIIQRTDYYIPGEVSYKYKFSNEYQSKYISLCLNDAKLKLRIEELNNDFKKASAKAIKKHGQQIKYLEKLTIDLEAFDYINTITDTHKYNCAEASATRILNNDIFYKIDETSGRFNSNITNLLKELRPYLKVNGEELINIDIKNSQPYLSTLLLTNPSKVSGMAKYPAFAMLLQTLKVSHNEDIKKYISLVISGQLYEYLMSEFAKEGLLLSRKDTKTQVLRILFSRNRLPRNPIFDKEIFIQNLSEKQKKAREEYIKDFPIIKIAREIFIKNFPTVHKKFSIIRGHKKGNHFQNFKRFAILLQSIEAYLMLERILKRIYKELPGTIAITIHDSIMTGVLTDNVEAVKKIMEEELFNYVGFLPKIAIEKQEKKVHNNISMLEGRIMEEVKSNTITNQYDATPFVSEYYSNN